MKKFLCFVISLLYCCLLVLPAGAFGSGAPSDIVKSGGFGSRVISESSTGDKLLSGLHITVTGSTGGDVLMLAGYGQIAGQVSGDIRALAGEIFIDEWVDGNVTVVASKVTVSPNAMLGKNLRVYANEVVIDGRVLGDAVIQARSLSINGAVGGDVSFDSGRAAVAGLAISPGADLAGRIIHRGMQRSAEASALSAKYTYQSTGTATPVWQTALYDILRLFGAAMLVYLFALLLFKLAPAFSGELCVRIRKSGVRSLARGSRLLLGLALLPPALALFAALSFFTLPSTAAAVFILAAAGIGAFLLILSFVPVALFAGWFIVRKLRRPAALMAVGLPPVFLLYAALAAISVVTERPIVLVLGACAISLAVLLLGGGAVVESARRLRNRSMLVPVFGSGSAADIADTTVFDAVTPAKDG